MLKYMDEGKQTLEREIDKILKTGDISVSTLEKLHKLTDTYKNMCKIYALEQSEESGGESSYEGGSSYRRGRGRNARRDSMGRYSSENGYSEEGGSYRGGSSYDDDMSYARGGQGGGRGQGGRGGQGGGRSFSEGGYSRNDAKDWMMSQLGEMMEDADPKEREALKKCMRAIEEA